MHTPNQPRPRDLPGPLTAADLATASGGRASPVLMLHCETGKHAPSPGGTVPLGPDDLRRAAGGVGSTGNRSTGTSYGGSGFDREH